MDPHDVRSREPTYSFKDEVDRQATAPSGDGAWQPLLPRFLLRGEKLALFALSIVLYFYLGGAWLLLIVLFLAPDISMLGYLLGPRLGAMTYNLFHNYAVPAVLAAVGVLASAPLAVLLALIWFAHIALDRALGYGLKHTSGFGDTHLGPIGRRRAT